MTSALPLRESVRFGLPEVSPKRIAATLAHAPGEHGRSWPFSGQPTASLMAERRMVLRARAGFVTRKWQCIRLRSAG